MDRPKERKSPSAKRRQSSRAARRLQHKKLAQGLRELYHESLCASARKPPSKPGAC